MAISVDERSTTTQTHTYQMYIDGQWVEAVSGATWGSVDPFDGTEWARVPDGDHRDVDRAVKAARRAFDEGPWSQFPGRERGQYIRRLAQLIDRDKDKLALTETRDNGKLIREMAGQLGSMPDWYEYFAGWADKIQGDVLPADHAEVLVYSQRIPVGVVAGITAWNSPLILAAYKLAPALAAGCTFILKPAEQASVSSLVFAELIEEAGFPPGVINVITGDGPAVGAPLVRHPGVDKIAFTGSTAAGIDVAQGAGTHLAKVSLELGGKSPNIVFGDAELDAAVNGVMAGVFAATGQTCVAGSRILIDRTIQDEFMDRLLARVGEIKLGDPKIMATEMGPIAFQEQFEKVLKYIEIGRDEGGEVLIGGGRPSQRPLSEGLFIEPTVLSGVSNSYRIAQEEIFGPVAMVIPFDDESEAIRLANDTQFGLAAGVWTRDIVKAHRAAAKLRAGTVWINSYRLDSLRVPCGGTKLSGYGREGGFEGLREYLQLKTVWVDLSETQRDPFVLG